jgi:RNase P/RNase MRP subunit p29
MVDTEETKHALLLRYYKGVVSIKKRFVRLEVINLDGTTKVDGATMINTFRNNRETRSDS